MLSPGREFVGSPCPPQIGGNSSPYHYHHGITYAHVDPLQASTPNKTPKKTLASRISNQLERFKRSSSADKSQSRIINVHDNFSPHFRPRRTFYNVIPAGPNQMRNTSGSMRSRRRYYVHPPVSASVTPSWVQPTKNHFVHQPLCVDLDAASPNNYNNANVCLCEMTNEEGRLCRRCGNERQASKAKVESWWRDWINSSFDNASKLANENQQHIRRSQSEESVSTTNNPYEAMRKQRLSTVNNVVNTTPRHFATGAGAAASCWNDPSDTPVIGESDHEEEVSEDDEEVKNRAYAEADLIYNSVRRRIPPAPLPHPGYMPYVNHPEGPSRLQRSSSSVIRRSVILKTPMLPKQPQNSASKEAKKIVYVQESPNGQDSSAKESSSENEDDPISDKDKLQKLQIRNLKRLREKVKEEEEKLRVLKSSSSSGSASAKIKESVDYDADYSSSASPIKVKNYGSLSRRSASSSKEDSKLMQLYNRRKRQQEQQLKSQFSAGDIAKNLDISKEVHNELQAPQGKADKINNQIEVSEVNNSHLFNDTTRIRMISRPSIKDVFANSQLGRRGISQSFKEKVPLRPKEPPPPPPPQTRLSRSSSNGKIIYDIAESEETQPSTEVVILHTNAGSSSGNQRRNSAPHKPPRSKRSQSFTPASSKSVENISPRAKSIEAESGPPVNGENVSSLVVVGNPLKSSSSSSLLSSSDQSKDKDHIYEEIRSETNKQQKRPLPPIPKVSTTSTVVSVSSKLSSLKAQIDEEDVKSIFVGATKYEILNYLEDAKERGVDNINADLNSEDTESVSAALADRHHANRVSQFSHDSSKSSGSSSNGSTIIIHNSKDKWTTSVEIERNDSGLGSETGGKSGAGKRPIKIRGGENSAKVKEQLICEDCDQPITETSKSGGEETGFDVNGSTCLACAKRRCERKEIITEIIETEIKYGRDLRIILEEFYRPMQVAGLLSHEQLSTIFLNVEELTEVNRQFTESLRDAIEIALDEGDEDLCTVKIGQLFKDAEPMLGAFKSYCTRQGSSSALLATLEKERELLRIFLRVSQMENTILRRMNLSSFLMVPVQRVTKYPLLLSRLLKVTPSHHQDRCALQESRERIEHHLENMNQEARDTNSTRLWRRISMINVSSYRKMDSQLDVLGNTTWGIRKMALDVLQWTNKSREDVNFVLEGKLMFTQATTEGRRPWNSKMAPVSALLVTLGRNSLEPPSSLQDDGSIHFPVETGASEAALLLIKEKNNRYSMIRDPIFLGNCIICWEQDWEDCFEVNEFVAKESLIFKGEDASRTRQWFKALQFYGSSLGNWRKRRNGMANIMIYGTSSVRTTAAADSSSAAGSEMMMSISKSTTALLPSVSASSTTSYVAKSSSLGQLVDLS